VRTAEVIALGDALALMLADGGTSRWQADQFGGSVAGLESNVATGLARLGHQVAFHRRVGADAAGALVCGMPRAEGVDTSLIEDPGRPTEVVPRDRLGSSVAAGDVAVSTQRFRRLWAAIGSGCPSEAADMGERTA
jgi:hypothetical protein